MMQNGMQTPRRCFPTPIGVNRFPTRENLQLQQTQREREQLEQALADSRMQNQIQIEQARIRELQQTQQNGQGQGSPMPRMLYNNTFQTATPRPPMPGLRFPSGQPLNTASVPANLPTLRDLRSHSSLNNQADAIIYGHHTTANLLGASTSQAHQTQQSQGLLHEPPTGSGPAYGSYASPALAQPQSKPIFLSPEMFCHRAGCTDVKFDQLTLAEFTEGYLNIILYSQQLAPAERWARLERLSEIMSTANTYQWPKVRALFGILQKEIQLGFRTWWDGISTLKERMLRPNDVIPATDQQDKTDKRAHIDTTHICKAYNYNTCADKDCKLSHICNPCFRMRGLEAAHTAGDCPHNPKRKQ